MNIEYKLLTKNEWSRPEKKDQMKPIKKLVLHWYGNAKQRATGAWKFFEERKYGKTSYGSAHFLIDLSGDIIQALPQEEMGYHVGSKTYTEYGLSISSYPNDSTLGIEMGHLNWEGQYSENTWSSAKELCYLLLKEYSLNADNITTHRAIVGWKECPKWFFTFPEELLRFKDETHELFNSGMYGIVNAGVVNVRSDVIKKERIVGKVKCNDRLELIGYRNGWFHISNGNFVGYIGAGYVEIL